jgi:AAA domain
MPAGLSHTIAAQLSGKMRNRKSIGLVSSIDSSAWIAAAGIRVGSGIADRLAINTVIEVAAWSREILEKGVLWDTETQLSPLTTLHVLAGSQDWPFPCWENGLVDIWHDIPVPHAAAALAHGFNAEIERRIWAAQSRVLLPIFDAARRGLIAKYLDELERHASPSNPYLKQVHERTFSYTTPWRFEWYELNKLLKNVMTSEEKGIVEDFKRSRDYLAHARIINTATLKQLSERWEKFADELTAPVPGWDWPRSGQCLSMTVGPAAGGKSTWASAQDIPVVSTDRLRIEMYGSLSAPGSQDSVFRTARAKVTSLMRAGSDAILDASHLHKSDRVRNAATVPPDLGVKYVIVDRKLEDKLSAVDVRKSCLVEEHHATFLSSVSECLEGDRLQHVKVIDMRAIE